MASTDRPSLTPQQRLAISRRALVRQLNGGEEAHRAAREPDDDLEYAHGDIPGAPPARETTSRGRRDNIWSSVARGVVQRWWRRHPAHAVGQLARPVLEHYARTEPAKLMAVAAATGAVLVLVKPWRLLSLTAVLAAVLKTSDVADIVNTLMQKTTSPPRKDPP
jgi:hypothetical protein